MKTQVKLSFLVLLLVSGFIVSAQQHPSKCGKWRWDVKTLTDQDGTGLLTQTPTQSTIDELVVVIPPKILHADNQSDGKVPRFSTENKVVEIIAFVTEVKHESDDSDLQIILKSSNSAITMIGEIPDPTCPAFDKFPQLRDQFTKAKLDGKAIWNTLKKTHKPVKVKITGVPFWDGIRDTNPTGVSQYCREIHPILKIEAL